MHTVDHYLESLKGIRRSRLEEVVDYIRTKYPHVEESCSLSPKWNYPTFKTGDNYVALASMKNYISIHFGRYGATKIIGERNPKIQTKVGCVNIKDKDEWPIEDIQKAIDFTLR